MKLTRAEEAFIANRRHRLAMRQAKRQPAPGRIRVVRERDLGFLSWLHEGLDCVACLRLGRAPSLREIEAAHLKLNSAVRGRAKRMGVRSDDRDCIPLCRFHHRDGTPCFDPAQAKFLAIMRWSAEDAIDYAAALHDAYRDGRDGREVVAMFAKHAGAAA